MDSLFVFTGAHGKYDLLTAEPVGRPTHIGADIAALLEPPRKLVEAGGQFACGDAVATVADGVVTMGDVPATYAGQLDALWAALNAAWSRDADATAVLDRLDLVQ